MKVSSSSNAGFSSLLAEASFPADSTSTFSWSTCCIERLIESHLRAEPFALGKTRATLFWPDFRCFGAVLDECVASERFLCWSILARVALTTLIFFCLVTAALAERKAVLNIAGLVVDVAAMLKDAASAS